MSSNYPASEERAIQRNQDVSNVDDSAKAITPLLARAKFSALQIDDASFVDCDPYNSTGQFVTDKIKEHFSD